MATISSHVLDSVVGDHASGIRIKCIKRALNTTEILFDVIANEEGRIAESFEVDSADNSTQYELIFHTAAYFDAQLNAPPTRQIMREVVVRFVIAESEERVHIPLMLSPHAYSLWWSA